MALDPFKVMIDVMVRLPQQGPGSKHSTLKALQIAGEKPDWSDILILGCGTGREVMDLLEATTANITAVDLSEPFLEKLADRAEKSEIPQTRLRVLRDDFTDPGKIGGEYDLVWSEGAIYFLGLVPGLKLWSQWLKAGGRLVVSEATWLTTNPGQAARVFWQNEYPEMGTVESNIADAETAGFECKGHFTLPDTDWTKAYYDPMKAALDELGEKYGHDSGAQSVFREMRKEIELFDLCKEDVGYVFYIFEKCET